MFKRSPYLFLIASLAVASIAVAPALATDEVVAPPPPPPAQPAQAAPPPTGALCTDNSKPSTKISTSSSSAAGKRVVRGKSSDRGCGASGQGSVARVTVTVIHKKGKRCQYMSSKGRLGKAKSCAHPSWLTANGKANWSFGLPKSLRSGTYQVRARALDSAGNVGTEKSLRVKVR